MLGRRVRGYQPKRLRARVYEVVQRPGGNEHHVARACAAGPAVQHRLALALDEKEDLVTLVRLLADVFTGLDRHHDNLGVLARHDGLAEVVVLSRELGVVLDRVPSGKLMAGSTPAHSLCSRRRRLRSPWFPAPPCSTSSRGVSTRAASPGWSRPSGSVSAASCTSPPQRSGCPRCWLLPRWPSRSSSTQAPRT